VTSGGTSRPQRRRRVVAGSPEAERPTTLIRALLGLAGTAFVVGIAAAFRQRHRMNAGLIDEVTFWPHLMFLLGAAVAALAAALATGGVILVRSGEMEAAPLREAPEGFWDAPVFRPWLALRDAALAALPVFAAAGFFAFVDYFATARDPSPGAVLLMLAWMVLVVRLAWAAFKRTVVARSLEDARVRVRPQLPCPDTPFHVRVEQPARRRVRVWSLEAALVCDRTITKWPRHGKHRSRTDEVYRRRLVLATDVLARPGLPAQGEGTFSVPPEAFSNEGYASWRVEVRTRLTGPNYHSRFPLVPVDRSEADDEDEGDE
jgi:hypothetical protein